MPKFVNELIAHHTSKLQEDYQLWLASETQATVRLYEVTIRTISQQIDFTSQVRRTETPVGRPLVTFASFAYASPTNGLYSLEWKASGQQDSDLIRIGASPKRFLLQLLQTQDVPVPRLQVVAIEGVESRGLLVATDPKSDPLWGLVK